jgi:hypothetical protein
MSAETDLSEKTSAVIWSASVVPLEECLQSKVYLQELIISNDGCLQDLYATRISSQHICHYTAKTQFRKFETNIPRKGIARPQSEFPHSCVCERFIYSHCSAQTRPGIGHLRKPPGVELIPCRRKPLRRTRSLRDPAQTQV